MGAAARALATLVMTTYLSLEQSKPEPEEAAAPEEEELTWREAVCDGFKNGQNYVIWGMAFASGATDVLTLVRYYAFATMMTGNSIYTATAVARGCWHDLWHYLWLILSYCSGMMTFRAIDGAM